MRTQLFFGFLLASSLVGCKWTDFDDLEKETWARSSDDPDLGSTDYAVSIAGVTTGTSAMSGGTLAVISDDTPNFSTVDYNSAANATPGANPVKLGTQHIGALQETPAFTTDGAGHIALVEKSITGGNYAVVFGTATAPAGIEIMANVSGGVTPSPDAAVLIGDRLLFAAGDTFYTVPMSTGTAITCTAKDAADMPLKVAGMAADSTNLYVWTQSGALVSYPLSGLDPCTGGMAPVPFPGFTSTSFQPASGARVFIKDNFVILAGHATTSRTGQVFVADTSTLIQTGETLTIEGLRSAALDDFGSGPYLAVGIPDKQVAKVAAGVVELYAFTPSTGTLAATPALTLHDADPESGQLFGRTITTMLFNGSPVLVVGADAEVFAYFKTSLYDHLP